MAMHNDAVGDEAVPFPNVAHRHRQSGSDDFHGHRSAFFIDVFRGLGEAVGHGIGILSGSQFKPVRSEGGNGAFRAARLGGHSFGDLATRTFRRTFGFNAGRAFG